MTEKTAETAFHPKQEAAYVARIIELMQEVKNPHHAGVIKRMVKRAKVSGERAEILKQAFAIWSDIPPGGDPKDVPASKPAAQAKKPKPTKVVSHDPSSPFAALLAIRPVLVEIHQAK